MDIKWKSKTGMLVWLVLIAYGLSGVLTLWFRAYNYAIQDLLFWIYTGSAVVALVLGMVLENRYKFSGDIAPEKWQVLYKKIPLDVAGVLFFITLIATLEFMLESYFLNYTYRADIINGIIYFLINITIWTGLTIIQGVYLYRRIKDFQSMQVDWKNSLFIRFLRTLRNAFLNRKVGTQVSLTLMVVFFLGLCAGLGAWEQAFILFFAAGGFFIGIPLIIIIVIRTGNFNRIIYNTSALANGSYAPDLEIKGKSPLAGLAADINKMKHGVQTSQKAQAKSERMKTELITNVSHDLRTPLTSIMTYAELLRDPALTEDERQAYVEIVDRKSKRLKVLIDDLFEASKMASGNMELIKEKIDITQLLQQALAEYDETIQESSIQFRVSNPDDPVYAMVDGQKLWRVFENLIGNIVKYSLANTRAYIQVKEANGKVQILFKNISEYELSENIDELFERFKRGDESRHTDGSGLGLAIAKSIIDLHGGSLDIDVDGDLFKVTISLASLGSKAD